MMGGPAAFKLSPSFKCISDVDVFDYIFAYRASFFFPKKNVEL